MASASDIKAGAAYVELYLKNNKFVRGLRNASRRLKAFGGSIRSIGLRVTAAGGMMVAPFVLAAKTFAKTGDTLNKMAARTGVSVESLSEMGFAAEQSGADLATLEKGIKTMQRSINDAGRGLSTQKDALKDLGLEYADFAGLSPEKQFKLIADRISQVEDPTKKAALAMMLLGRSGQALLPMMQGGAAGIEALQKQARDLGLTVTTADAAGAAQFTDQMNILWRVLKMGVFKAGAALGPMLISLTDRITTAAMVTSKWISENKAYIVLAAKVAAGVMAAGAAITALGITIVGAGAVLGTMASGIAMVGTVLGALLSPIGLVSTAIIGLAVYFAHTSGGIAKSIEWLSSVWDRLKENALAAFAGIRDAMAAGDMKLAAKILWLTLKQEWTRGTNWLLGKWMDFKEAFLTVWTDSMSILSGAFLEMGYGLQSMWAKTTKFFIDKWKWVEGSLAKGIAYVIAKIQGLDPQQVMGIVGEQYNRERKARNITHKEQLRGIEERRTGAHDMLAKENRAAHARRRAGYAGQQTANERALEDAERELAAAIATAKTKRAGMGAIGAAPALGKVPDLGMVAAGLSVGGGRKTSAKGAFSAIAAMRGLGAAGPIDKIAETNKQIAENTKGLRKKFTKFVFVGE